MKTLKNVIALTTLLASTSAFGIGEIVCETPRGSKTITIKKTAVSLSTPFSLEGRGLASMKGVRTKIHGTGFTKIWYHNGNKHTVFIEDASKFSEVDDYMVVRSQKGHEMTYPLKCSK